MSDDGRAWSHTQIKLGFYNIKKTILHDKTDFFHFLQKFAKHDDSDFNMKSITIELHH